MGETQTVEVPKAGTILCTNRRGYPAQYGYAAGIMDITVVLVAGAIGDYAAYAGMGEPQWVAQHGDKIPFAEACIHFPVGLEEDRYRK